MKLKLYSLLLLACFLLSFDKPDECKKNIRTDGYYLYSYNLDDTFNIVTGSKEDWVAASKFVQQELGLSPVRKSPCLPDSVIFTGGPIINYIAFFNDSVGTSIVTQCKDSAVHYGIIELIKNRSQNSDTTRLEKAHTIYNISCTGENSIEFYVSKYDFFNQRYKGVISEDNLVIVEFGELNPYGADDQDGPKVYHFHKFTK